MEPDSAPFILQDRPEIRPEKRSTASTVVSAPIEDRKKRQGYNPVCFNGKRFCSGSVNPYFLKQKYAMHPIRTRAIV